MRLATHRTTLPQIPTVSNQALKYPRWFFSSLDRPVVYSDSTLFSIIAISPWTPVLKEFSTWHEFHTQFSKSCNSVIATSVPVALLLLLCRLPLSPFPVLFFTAKLKVRPYAAVESDPPGRDSPFSSLPDRVRQHSPLRSSQSWHQTKLLLPAGMSSTNTPITFFPLAKKRIIAFLAWPICLLFGESSRPPPAALTFFFSAPARPPKTGIAFLTLLESELFSFPPN